MLGALTDSLTQDSRGHTTFWTFLDGLFCHTTSRANNPQKNNSFAAFWCFRKLSRPKLLILLNTEITNQNFRITVLNIGKKWPMTAFSEKAWIEYRSDDVTKTFFCISAFWIPCLGGAWWTTSTAQIWWESVHGGPEIWPHEYLLSPIEISVNWPGSNSYEPGQLFTPISMGLIRYSCGHILGHHEPIHVKFGVWRFFIMLYRNMVMKVLKCKQIFLMTSHFGTLLHSYGNPTTSNLPRRLAWPDDEDA